MRTHLALVKVRTQRLRLRGTPRHPSGSRRVQHRCCRAGALLCGQGRSATPDARNVAVDTPPLPLAEIAASFSPAELTNLSTCKNNVNTLSRVYFSSPSSPFPETCSPIHCPCRHKKLLQIPPGPAASASAAPAPLLLTLGFLFPAPA